MTILTPPTWLENSALHNAQDYRTMLASLTTGRSGIVTDGALEVTERAGTPNMSVDVAAGGVLVASTRSSSAGTYHVYNDGTVNVPLSAADATNPRIDRVLVQVRDEEQDAALTDNDARILVVEGTPAPAPALPAITVEDYVELAQVTVPASATSISNTEIDDQRRRAVALGGATPSTPTTRPGSPNVGELIVEDGLVYAWDGAAWQLVEPPAVACRVGVDIVATGNCASGAWDTIHWDAVRDPYGLHDGAVRFTADRAGWWTLEASVAPGNHSGDGRRILGYSLNGGSELGVDSDDMTSSGNPYLHLSITEYLEAGDYLRVHWFQESGAVLALSANGRAGASFKYDGP